MNDILKNVHCEPPKDPIELKKSIELMMVLFYILQDKRAGNAAYALYTCLQNILNTIEQEEKK